ncbi:MAG TPA: PqqD family protein [Bacteroidales bacterium]|nr:PqqD family protein [Bacteroidales bacterium]
MLNTTAMAIWDLMDGHRTLREIAEEIANICEVDVAIIQDDVSAQVGSFYNLGFVEEVM